MVDVVGSGEGTGGYTSFSAVSAPATGLSTGGPAASSRLSGAPQLAGGPVGDKSLPRRQGVHGYMNKYTGEGSFQRRYFELRGNCLLYFVDARATDPKGVILLDGAKGEALDIRALSTLSVFTVLVHVADAALCLSSATAR